MVFGMNYLVVKTVKDHPGLTLEEIAELISKIDTNSSAPRWLLMNDCWELKELLDRQILCIEQRDDGHYYFIPNPKEYHTCRLTDELLKIWLENDTKAKRDEALRKLRSKPSGD